MERYSLELPPQAITRRRRQIMAHLCLSLCQERCHISLSCKYMFIKIVSFFYVSRTARVGQGKGEKKNAHYYRTRFVRSPRLSVRDPRISRRIGPGLFRAICTALKAMLPGIMVNPLHQDRYSSSRVAIKKPSVGVLLQFTTRRRLMMCFSHD